MCLWAVIDIANLSSDLSSLTLLPSQNTCTGHSLERRTESTYGRPRGMRSARRGRVTDIFQQHSVGDDGQELFVRFRAWNRENRLNTEHIRGYLTPNNYPTNIGLLYEPFTSHSLLSGPISSWTQFGNCLLCPSWIFATCLVMDSHWSVTNCPSPLLEQAAQYTWWLMDLAHNERPSQALVFPFAAIFCVYL